MGRALPPNSWPPAEKGTKRRGSQRLAPEPGSGGSGTHSHAHSHSWTQFCLLFKCEIGGCLLFHDLLKTGDFQ